MVLYRNSPDGVSASNSKLFPSPPASITKLPRRLLGDVLNALNGAREPTIQPAPSVTSTPTAPAVVKKHQRRNVRFTQTVKVYYMNDDGHLLTEDEAICEEPKESYRSLYLGKPTRNGGQNARGIPEGAEHLERGVRRTLSYPGAGESCDEYETLIDELTLKYGAELSGRFLTGTQNLAETITSSDSSPASQKREAGISFERDFTTQLLTLKLVLHLGSEYKSDDVLVRANVRGNILRVVSNVNATTGKPTNQQAPLVDTRFELPLNVDPYQVHAKMDSSGCLTIEAPLVVASSRARVYTFP